MPKQHSLIRGLVTSALNNVLDLMSVLVVFVSGAMGYAVGSARGNDLFGLVIGVLAGLAVVALLFGVVYVLIEIAEQTKAAAQIARETYEQNGRWIAAIELRLAKMETHIARLDDAQMSDHAAKSVKSAVGGP